MFRWCSFCQKYMGEKPPFDNLTITHGMCFKCKDHYNHELPRTPEIIQEHREFFKMIQNKAKEGGVFELNSILKRAHELKIDALDLLLGTIQPTLHYLGELFVQKEITTTEEHLFSAFTNNLIDRIAETIPSSSENCQVLLSCVPGNTHSLGIRMLDLELKRAGIPSMVLYPGLPPHDLLSFTAKVKPQILGLSVAEEKNMEDVEKTIELLQKDPSLQDVHLIIGGNALKRPGRSFKGTTVFQSIYSRDEFLETILSLLSSIKKQQAA